MNLYNSHKEPHFIEAYKKHFAGLKPKRLLEIGVQGGGSLKIWRDMFPGAEIVGVDIDEACKEHEGENITVHIGSQKDMKFLESLGEFDIIIDDGGHKMSEQQVSFYTLIKQLNPGGIYVIEDLHTSYWEQFLDLPYTTIGFLQTLVDDIHEYADKSPRSLAKRGIQNRFGLTSVCFYAGIAFITK